MKYGPGLRVVFQSLQSMLLRQFKILEKYPLDFSVAVNGKCLRNGVQTCSVGAILSFPGDVIDHKHSVHPYHEVVT